MICMLDEDDNGTLNFTEFQKLLQYISKWKVWGIAHSALHACSLSRPLLLVVVHTKMHSTTLSTSVCLPCTPVQVVFRQIDHNHSGTIERDESFEALQKLGFDIPASARSALFNRFAKKRQYMDFDDFVACCCRAELMHSEFFESRQSHMHYTRQDIFLLRTLQEFGNEVI